jgi:hypothetical protein
MADLKGIMKAVQDYLNDPRILNDKGLMDARIGEAEYNKKVEATLAERGITLRRDLTGQGKITPAMASVK